MAIYITQAMNNGEFEKLFLEAAYSGERFFVQREDGVSFAIVPCEDLQILEEVESIDSCS